MHIEGARRGRDVAIVFLQNTVDVFPFKAINRGRLGVDREIGGGAVPKAATISSALAGRDIAGPPA
jgi:hypothetical protein